MRNIERQAEYGRQSDKECKHKKCFDMMQRDKKSEIKTRGSFSGGRYLSNLIDV